jgi:hypothetical protein
MAIEAGSAGGLPRIQRIYTRIPRIILSTGLRLAGRPKFLLRVGQSKPVEKPFGAIRA